MNLDLSVMSSVFVVVHTPEITELMFSRLALSEEIDRALIKFISSLRRWKNSLLEHFSANKRGNE